MTTKSSDTAFPLLDTTNGTLQDGDYIHMGLTKREYFAATALQGICSNQEFLKNLNAEPSQVAKACTEIADALIKALNEKP